MAITGRQYTPVDVELNLDDHFASGNITTRKTPDGEIFIILKSIKHSPPLGLHLRVKFRSSREAHHFLSNAIAAIG